MLARKPPKHASKQPTATAVTTSAFRNRRAACILPCASSRGNSALHAVKMGSVRNERSQKISRATLCVAPGTTPSADADAVRIAYVPILETAPRNIQPISFAIFVRFKTSSASRQPSKAV